MDNPRDQTLGIVTITTVAVCVMAILIAAEPAVTFNPTTSLNEDDFNPIQIVLPEGFAFFTRDAQENDLYLYQKDGQTWTTASMGPNSRAANLFGLNRKSRAQGVESALITSKIKPDIWSECEDDPATCLTQISVQDTVRNVVPEPTLCGPTGFVLQEPVPWAWSKSRDTIDMYSKLTKIEIQC